MATNVAKPTRRGTECGRSGGRTTIVPIAKIAAMRMAGIPGVYPAKPAIPDGRVLGQQRGHQQDEQEP
jgi:hypothetical protein